MRENIRLLINLARIFLLVDLWGKNSDLGSGAFFFKYLQNKQ